MKIKSSVKDDLLAYARSLGFERVGITSPDPLPKNQEFFAHWLEQGRAGEMHYLEREPARRSHAADHLPNAKSVIAMAVSYYPGEPAATEPPEGKVSRYAWGRDYHKVIEKRLKSVVRYLEALAPGSAHRVYVDTGPLLERAFAQRAGLGFIGKNTMLISRGLGSWIFLASIVTTVELSPDAPDFRSCGECRLCIDACPTEAITAPYELDPRRCISYLTIEQRGPVDPELRSRTEGWMFGCDVCQEVCPHNARPTLSSLFAPQASTLPTLEALLSLESEQAFRERFAGTPFMRTGWEGMLRNACVAAASLSRNDLIPSLEKWTQTGSPLVREQAQWALTQLTANRNGE